MSRKVKPDDVLDAILDPRAVEAIAKALAPFITTAFDKCLTDRLSSLLTHVDELRAENVKLNKELLQQSQRIDDLEAYSRSENLIIRGLPEASVAERSSATLGSSSISHADTCKSVETNVNSFCRDSLNVTVAPQDISIAHRIKAGPKEATRPIIVCFTSRRVRNEVYQARKADEECS